MKHIEKIIYYLEYCHYLAGEVFFSAQEKNDLIDYLRRGTSSTLYLAPTIKCENRIIPRCDDKTMRVAIIRNVNDIEIKDETTLLCKKRKYKFDNVYKADHSSNYVDEIYDFIKTRIDARKDVSLLAFGYSSSGKSTLINKLINISIQGCTYRLYEIYNNKLYVYMNCLKVIQTELLSSHSFTCANIVEVVDMFSKKQNTEVNLYSSRSHCVLELIYPDCTVSLIDTAGNEKYGSADTKETQFINKSLYNVSRFLQNQSHKDNKCLLLKTLKNVSNIIVCLLLNDNGKSLASSHLSVFEKLLSYV